MARTVGATTSASSTLPLSASGGSIGVNFGMGILVDVAVNGSIHVS